MNLLDWQKSRLIILRYCSLTILVALVFLCTKSDKYIFPQAQALKQRGIVEPTKILAQNNSLEGRRLQKAEEHNLAIEIYHIPINNLGNQKLIDQYLDLNLGSSNLTIRENENIGSYGLFSSGNKIYLTTCIHSQGKIAFTHQQFAKLANHKLKHRLLPWIFGLSDLRDWSCLWVNMSVSLDNINQEEASLLLQQQLFDLASLMKFDVAQSK